MRSRVAFVLLATLLPGSGVALTLGVHPEEPAPALGELLAELAPAELPIRVRSFPDQLTLANALRDGQIDAALLEAPAERQPGVALIADLYPSVLHILYPRSWSRPDLQTLLTRGTVWAGGAGSIGRKLVQELREDYQLPEDAVTLLPDPISVTPDVWMIFGGILSRDALSRLPDYQLFDFEAPTGPGDDRGSDGIAEGIALRYPQLHTMSLPRRLYPSLDSPRITTLAVHNQLAVRQSLADDAAYGLAQLVSQARQVLASRYPLSTLAPAHAGTVVPHALVAHPGAARFDARNEPSFLERYAEVFAFLLTALVALASGSVALARYRQQRRKDRLDRFFQRLLAERAIEQSPATRADTIRALQSDVIELVVRERISADGALLAFLSLSNQLLSEAEAAAV